MFLLQNVQILRLHSFDLHNSAILDERCMSQESTYSSVVHGHCETLCLIPFYNIILGVCKTVNTSNAIHVRLIYRLYMHMIFTAKPANFSANSSTVILLYAQYSLP